MEWLFLVNLFFVFFNGYIAVKCFSRGQNFVGHLNMGAVVVNGLIVALKII